MAQRMAVDVSPMRAREALTALAERRARVHGCRTLAAYVRHLCAGPPHLYAPCWAPSLASSVEVLLFAPFWRPASLRTRSLASAHGDVPCAGVQPGVHTSSEPRPCAPREAAGLARGARASLFAPPVCQRSVGGHRPSVWPPTVLVVELWHARSFEDRKRQQHFAAAHGACCR